MEQNSYSCSIGIWNYHLAPSKSESRIFLWPYASPLCVLINRRHVIFWMSISKVCFRNCLGTILSGFSKWNKTTCLLFIKVQRRVWFWLYNLDVPYVWVTLTMDIFIYGRNCFQNFLGDLPTWGGNLGPKLHPGGGFFGP